MSALKEEVLSTNNPELDFIFSQIIQVLEQKGCQPKEDRSSVMAFCPVCQSNDKTRAIKPSPCLRAGKGRQGVSLHCYSGCEAIGICKNLDIAISDLWLDTYVKIKNKSPQLEKLIGELDKKGCTPERILTRWQAVCPRHKDQGSIFTFRDGRSSVEIKLPSCCSIEDANIDDLLRALGLHRRDLAYDKPRENKTTFTFIDKQPLTSQDYQKLETSYISKDLADKAELFRVDSFTAREMLGIKAKGDYSGIIFPYFIDGNIVSHRLRRDHPQIEQKADGSFKEENKYRSAPGASIYPYIPRAYTHDQLKDKNRKIVIVEGEKKALGLYAAFQEINDPSIVVGLSGVWCFTSKIGKKPAPNGGYQDIKGLLRDIANLGLEDRNVSIIFDTNIHTNEDVIRARSKLVRVLKEHKAKPTTIDLPKELLDEGLNGVDDILHSKGKDYLINIIKLAEEKAKANVDLATKPLRPKGSIIADLLTEQYQDRLIYNAATKMWFFYCNNKWENLESEIVRKQVQKDVKTHYENTFSYFDGFEDKDITSIISLLKSNITLPKWETKPYLLPLQNGVLDLKTKELKPHSPEHYLTWQLPYAYNPSATCQPIIEWLLAITQGDFQIVQFLRAYLRAVLLGRTDLQVYLELIGFGGSGKGTFIRLVTALIGSINTAVTDLENLETNRFETAKLFGKRLAVITDADQYSKSLRVLKQLTGQDRLRAEKKGKDAFDFTPECMVIVASNEPIVSADSSSGVARRKRTVIFNKQIDALQRRNLVEETREGFAGEFVQHLPGLLNWTLEMTDAQMIDAIHNTYEKSPLMQQNKVENLLNVHPLATWFDEKITVDPNAKGQIGYDHSANPEQQLYANYYAFAKGSGTNPLSVKRFSTLLEDLCVAQLKLKAYKKRITEGTFFFGIRLRMENDQPYSISGNIPSQPYIYEGSMKGTMKGLLTENAEFIENVGLFENTSLVEDENVALDNADVADQKVTVESDSQENVDVVDASYREEVEKSDKTLHKTVTPLTTTLNPTLNPTSTLHYEGSTLHSEKSKQLISEETEKLVNQAKAYVAQNLHLSLPEKICANTPLEQYKPSQWLQVFLNEINDPDEKKREKAVKEIVQIMLAIQQYEREQLLGKELVNVKE